MKEIVPHFLKRVAGLSALATASLFTTPALALEPGHLVGYWPFDQIGSNVASDYSGNGNDATLDSQVQQVAVGVYGGSLELMGGTGKASYDSDEVDQLTVMGFIYLKSLTPEDQGGTTAPRLIEAPAFAVFFSPSEPALVFEYRYDDFLESKWSVPLPNDIVGRWIQWVIVFDKHSPTQEPVFYINAERQVNPVLVEMTAGAPISNDGTAYIGNRAEGDRGIDGYLDELRIYNALLNDAEVAQLYHDAGKGFLQVFPTSAPMGNGYYNVPWLGWMNPAYHPWIYHYYHGWLYLPEGQHDSSCWLYNATTFDNAEAELGWIWAGSSAPGLIWTANNGWASHIDGTLNPRTFYSYDNANWFQAN